MINQILTLKIFLLSFYCFSCTKKNSLVTPPQQQPPVVLPTATIDANNTKHQIIFKGGDMERCDNAVQNSANKTEIIKWAFGDIPFNAFYSGTVQSMKDIKAVNKTIKCMASMGCDYEGFNQVDTNNLPVWIYNRQTKILNLPKYGKFLANYLEYMKLQGVPIDYLSTAKEWTSVVKPDSVVKLINILKTELFEKGVAMPLIMDPASWSITSGIDYVNRLKQLGETGQVFAFCTHNYNTSETKNYKNFFNAVAATGKLAFHDETNTGGGRFTPSGINPPITSLLSAYKKRVEMYESGCAGEIFFELWSRGVNAESRSIYFANNGTGERRRAYYLMKDFATGAVNSNYIPLAFTNSTGITGMAFKKNKQLFVWLINSSKSNITSFKISVGNATMSGTVPKTNWREATQDAGEQSSISASTNGKELVTELIAESIAFLKITIQ
jgi:O-glycosyl hydrolase